MRYSKQHVFFRLLVLGTLVFLFFTPVGSKVMTKFNGWVAESATVAKVKIPTPLDTYTWELEDMNSNAFHFETQKGKVVFVNFWATWCPPCVAEMPSLQKLHDAYKDKVTFMFVARDEPERVSKFLKKKGYDLPVYYSKTQRPDVLASKLLPTTYIVDRYGKVILTETGAMDWYSEKVREELERLITVE
ncbi:TlpA disulfide reductase family protein [Ulvibacterium sp.]|uniref:TlpA family protein disulfide reductase n=1 Tax=Ulvibacterium sp. TaxID=2665914 RepID=UPI0026132A9E|nr:TlpA disulfide reductase family protein [Ulvibacterium sp.]